MKSFAFCLLLIIIMLFFSSMYVLAEDSTAPPTTTPDISTPMPSDNPEQTEDPSTPVLESMTPVPSASNGVSMSTPKSTNLSTPRPTKKPSKSSSGSYYDNTNISASKYRDGSTIPPTAKATSAPTVPTTKTGKSKMPFVLTLSLSLVLVLSGSTFFTLRLVEKRNI
jgi:hypothetical protein